MFLMNFFNGGIFQPRYRNQLLTTMSVTIISLCHGLNLGWLSPMLPVLQDHSVTPLDFVVNIEEVSWVGSILSIGGIAGGILYGLIFERVGRKISIYLMAIPNMLLWILIYFAKSIEYLYVARFFGGMTGSVYLVLPIFISEIADSEIRGRLGSMFNLSLNIGIFMGYIISSQLHYHVVPCVMISLPILYLFLATFYPETPQHLLRHGRDEEAKESFKFYQNFQAATKEDFLKFNADFTDLQAAVSQQIIEKQNVDWRQYCNIRSLKALSAGLILVCLNIFSGQFALINYMSSIFAATESEVHPNTNTIIIGLVQICGSYGVISAVDRYGRKILMIISYSGMGVGLAVFGMYAFVAEETDIDLSMFGWWVPLTIMSFVVFIANLGVTNVTFLLFFEIMPPAIRSDVVRICVTVQCIFAFISLKMFPIFMNTFGLSASIWFCASVCAFGTFYIFAFIPETKGKSMNRDEKQYDG